MVDLHCHTTASDGLMTPTDLIRMAAKEGVTVIAIADHDTADGLDEAAREARQEGINFLPAIELSVSYPTGEFHLLGYGIRHHDEDFRDKLAQLKSIREERVLKIVERLNRAGVQLTREDVCHESNGAAPGKPHVARALIKKGYASDIHSALRTYLDKGAPGYVSKEKLSPESAIGLIRSAGGLPVLAHPKSLRCRDYREYEHITQELTDQGIAGIEVYATMHDKQDVKLFGELAKRHHLLVTGGSDFHGDNGGRLGYYGYPRLIPESCSRALLQYGVP
ncbi:PHP domain-containing protein [Syntrophus buswellii]|jgi:predicted metal-dependent phosphoesterase TrpH|uniref:PHP domain-containing protein n=1 Tax=Syntrophus TaxID=43773 RepID=UPI0009C6EA9D|nr:PHP domain-containing protein [Syntrophus sp. (in: bacteria)]OPY10933.1 MAG: hypothetical protein A4E69_03092 [Syntrophus sp. PtaB.Bin138]